MYLYNELLHMKLSTQAQLFKHSFNEKESRIREEIELLHSMTDNICRWSKWITLRLGDTIVALAHWQTWMELTYDHGVDLFTYQ